MIHAGIYYTAGSLKSQLCVEGNALLYDYLDSKNLRYKKCGKLIVATEPHEVTRLKDLFQRGSINGAKDLKLVTPEEAKQIEPRVSCLQGLWSPHTGITDYAAITNSYGQDVLSFSETGSSCIINSFEVGRLKVIENQHNKKSSSSRNEKIIILENCNDWRKCKESSPFQNEKKSTVATREGVREEEVKEVRAKFMLSAGGLWADKLSIMTGSDPLPGIVPFRGEYLLIPKKHRVKQPRINNNVQGSNPREAGKQSHLNSTKQENDKDVRMKNDSLLSDRLTDNIFQTNIYPVPDPEFPFLGMHFTPRLDGSVIIGPDALFAFSRKGYSMLDIDLQDTLDALSHPGFKKLAFKYFRTGLQEMSRSLSLQKQVEHVNRMINPGLRIHEVVKGPTGVRAQALDAEGNLIEDFIFDWGYGDFKDNVLHVRNAPSPAATSSLAIAKVIVDKIQEKIAI